MNVGDTVQHRETGVRRVITHITPAGAMGTSVSDGPTYHAVIVGDGGKAVHRGHSVAIWSGSMHNPIRDWEVVTNTLALRRAAGRLTDKDLPEGYAVEKQEYEMPCDHVACDTVHRHLYNASYEKSMLVTLYSMSGEECGTRWESRYHMAQRTEWVILLDGNRVGDAHDRKQDALAEAVTSPTI